MAYHATPEGTEEGVLEFVWGMYETDEIARFSLWMMVHSQRC